MRSAGFDLEAERAAAARSEVCAIGTPLRLTAPLAALRLATSSASFWLADFAELSSVFDIIAKASTTARRAEANEGGA